MRQHFAAELIRPIEMLSSVGDTLVESTPVLRVYGARKVVGERELMNTVRTGGQRTFEQDPVQALGQTYEGRYVQSLNRLRRCAVNESLHHWLAPELGRADRNTRRFQRRVHDIDGTAAKIASEGQDTTDL